MELSEKEGLLGRPRAGSDHTVTIWKETKRTEKLKETGYRLPTWVVLQALQQINSAMRIDGKAARFSPRFFLSAERGDLLFWAKKQEPTIVMWESPSEQKKGKLVRRGKHDARLGCVLQVKKRGGRNSLI